MRVLHPLLAAAILASTALVAQAPGYSPDMPAAPSPRVVVPVAPENPLVSMARASARRWGLPEAAVLAIVARESGWNPATTGSAGEMGLMQVMPSTWDWTVRRLGVAWTRRQALDPARNLEVGCAHLRWLWEYFWERRARMSCGSLDAAVMAYNWGQANVARARGRDRWTPRSVRRYRDAILLGRGRGDV